MKRPSLLRYSISVQVYVKVTEVQNDDRGGIRIGCSIRAVDQETGNDMDPENKLTARNRSVSTRTLAGSPLDAIKLLFDEKLLLP